MFLRSSEIGKNEFTATAVGMYSGMRLDEICNIQKAHISDNCFRVLEGKTKAAKRAIPVHPVIEPLVERFLDSSKDDYLIKGIKSGGYDKKRSWNFQKKLTCLRKKLGMPARSSISYLKKYICNTNGELGNSHEPHQSHYGT